MKFKTLITCAITYLLVGTCVGLGVQLATYMLPSAPINLKINVDDVQTCTSELEFV
jgi:hypothetical protein